MSEVTTRHCAVMFADLRGSSSLFVRMGNTSATTLVTQSLSVLKAHIEQGGGQVIKTLGDGLMALFDSSACAVSTARQLHDALEDLAPSSQNLLSPTPVMTLKIALAWGEVVMVDGDCYGDAINVASRVLELTGDHETLATHSLVQSLPSEEQGHFGHIERLHLRGRQEPVGVLRLLGIQFGDTESMQPLTAPAPSSPDRLRLTHGASSQVFWPHQLPITLGRSKQSTCQVAGAHVSRVHARIEGRGGHFCLVDVSYNGTFVKFDHDQQTLTLRRDTCTLHGSGSIALEMPHTQHAREDSTIRFEIISGQTTSQ